MRGVCYPDSDPHSGSMAVYPEAEGTPNRTIFDYANSVTPRDAKGAPTRTWVLFLLDESTGKPSPSAHVMRQLCLPPYSLGFKLDPDQMPTAGHG